MAWAFAPVAALQLNLVCEGASGTAGAYAPPSGRGGSRDEGPRNHRPRSRKLGARRPARRSARHDEAIEVDALATGRGHEVLPVPRPRPRCAIKLAKKAYPKFSDWSNGKGRKFTRLTDRVKKKCAAVESTSPPTGTTRRSTPTAVACSMSSRLTGPTRQLSRSSHRATVRSSGGKSLLGAAGVRTRRTPISAPQRRWDICPDAVS